MTKKGRSAPTPVQEDRSWMARDDMNTLMRAEEIRGNKQRMSAAKNEAAKAMAAAKKVVGSTSNGRSK